MSARIVVLGLLLAAAGCEPLQLRNHVVRQAATLSDIQYQQVLDNLAMFRQNPASLPYFSLAPTGSVQIQQVDAASGGVNWDYAFLGSAGAFINHADKKTLGLMASQQTVGAWATSSVLNPDELSLMRCAYQRTVGCEGPECEKNLAAFFKQNQDRLDALRPGWYGAGRWKDVPHCACRVGHYGDCYVWVTPEGMDGLTRFTLAILDIATTLAPKPDPHLVQLAELEQRLTTVNTIYKGLPDNQTPEGKKLKAEIDKLLTQYNTVLEEHLKERPAESDLFTRIRKDFQIIPPPTINPSP